MNKNDDQPIYRTALILHLYWEDEEEEEKEEKEEME